MLDKGKFENIMIDSDHSDQLIKVMDMFVILLEGGNENDFKILESDESKLNIDILKIHNMYFIRCTKIYSFLCR